MRIHRSLFALAAVLVAGCANIDYPKEWSPSLHATTGCAPIDGTYQNRPSSVVPQGAPVVELRSFLDPGVIPPSRWVAPPTSAIQTVTLEHRNGVLTIIERSEGKSEATQLRVDDRHTSPESGSWTYNWTWGNIRPPDTIICTRGAWYRTGEEVVLEGFLRNNPFLGDAATQVSGWSFERAEDGSLAVRLHHGTLALVPLIPLPIPTSTEKWIWYRYEMVK